MNYTDKNGKGWKIGDEWKYCGEIYTIVRDDAFVYLKHPSDRATFDDHIPMNYLNEGEII